MGRNMFWAILRLWLVNPVIHWNLATGYFIFTPPYLKAGLTDFIHFNIIRKNYMQIIGLTKGRMNEQIYAKFGPNYQHRVLINDLKQFSFKNMNFLVKIPSNFRGTYPKLGKAFILGSLTMLSLSGYNYYSANDAEKQVEFRKQQLKLPVYKLSEEEHITPPWNQDNINEWLYRRVEVTGRIIHRNTCLVPHQQNGADGFQYVVPLLVKQETDRSNPQGLIVSKGFLPYALKDIGVRYRIQKTDRRSFIGFVSQLPELKNKSLLDGNVTDQDKLKFNNADLQDFVKAAGFVNKKQAAVAIVEELRQTGQLDERNYVRRDLDCTSTVNYPYAKTQSGALQLQKMPWDYKNDAKSYLWSSLASFVIGASIF